MWRSEDVLDKSALDADDWENPARAKFMVNNDTWDDDNLKIARKQGLIRIIPNSDKLNNQEELNKLYIQWLDIWLKNNKKFKIILLSDVTRVLLIHYKNNVLNFVTETDNIGECLRSPDVIIKNLFISHGNQRSYNCNVRSHGVFWTKFFNFNNFKTDPSKLEIFNTAFYSKLTPEEKKKIDTLQLEFWETVLTKIVIFDNRIYQRIPESYKEDKDKVNGKSTSKEKC